jgi:hypothetical protein
MVLGPWTPPHPTLCLNIKQDEMTELQTLEWLRALDFSPSLLIINITQDERAEL